jgi:signal transduction histidine kinase
MMPGMDGFEVTRRIRQDAAHRLLPIILVTALREKEDRIKGIEAGCDDFISKPVDKMEILARVRSLLKVKAYNDLMNNYRKELEFEVTKRTEELKHAFENLQQQIIERKKAEETKVELEASKHLSEMKTRFVSVATHELRTPLVSIKGYTDMVLSGDAGEVPSKIKELLIVVSRSTDRLMHITNDLLDVQRIESGRLKMDMKPMDLRAVLKQCISELKPLMDEKHHTFTVQVPDNPLQINGDFSRLDQVISNILANSQKFTPDGGKVEVSVQEKKESVSISVKDNGIGIRKEDIGKVFDVFSDIKTHIEIKGTGLGLSVAKGIIEAHGGKITAESDGEGKGATFTITLPKLEGSFNEGTK